MSNARNLANLLGTGTQITTADIADGAFQANKNLVINGAMQVAQRGTSFTLNSGNTQQYTLDRFECYNTTSSTTLTVTQDSDTPSVFVNSLKIANSTAHTLLSSDYATIGYKVEGYDMSATGMGTSAAKDITLSFWVKASITGTFGVTIRAGSSATANYTASYDIDSANTWEHKTITFPATSSGTWGTGNGIGGDFFFDLGVGSLYSQSAGSWNTSSNLFGLTGGTKLVETAGATWQITGVQLEVGDTATPFEHRSFGDELIRCQRYYEEVSFNEVDKNRPSATCAISNNIYFNMTYKVTKRTNSPSVTFNGGSIFNGSWGTFTSPTVVGAGDKAVHLTGTATAAQNSSYLIRNIEVTVDAEL